MKKLMLAAAVGLSLAGCMSVPPLTTWPVDGAASTTTVREPEAGKTHTVTVGESMLKAGRITTIKRGSARLLEDAEGSMDLGHTIKVASGTELKLQTRREDGTPVACAKTGGAGVVMSGSVVGCLSDQNRDGVFESSTFAERLRYFPLTKPVRYEVVNVTETQIENAPDFHIDALYQGLAKGVIKVSFREFKGGIARPAFTQDVSYELEPDGTGLVVFRDTRIRVLKATGSQITYVVDKHPAS